MSCRWSSSILKILTIASFAVNADSQFDRCLLEAMNKNAADYNCSKYLERQDDNVALTSQDKEMYAQCLKTKEQVAAAAAQKCKDESARSTADQSLMPESPPAEQNSKRVETASADSKKDQSRVNTDSTSKTATGKTQTSTPKSDKASSSSATSVADAQAQIQSDLDQCTNLQNQASRCCGNPLNCAGSMNQSDQQSLAQLLQSQNQQQGQSMTDYCNQLRTQSANSGSVNNALAQVCSNPQSSCSATCSSMANKYLNLANSHEGTDLGNAYISAFDQFNSAANTCDRLASRATQLAAQGISSGSTQSMSQACQQASAASPTNMIAPNGNPVGTSPTPARLDATVNCQANPRAAECQNQNLAPQGKTGFDTQAKGDTQFDVPDVGTRSTDYFGNNDRPQPAAAKVNAVPNNSGGGFGIGDSGSTKASLNSRDGRRPPPGSPGYTTDIMQGTMSGGGYSYGSGSGSGSGLEGQSYGSRFFAGRNKPAKNDDGGMLGMDLRQFLPGGSRAHRALAGFNGRSEINAKEEDIWRRISNKMIEKCKLGVLWRCE
jgi:hypothetical protein